VLYGVLIFALLGAVTFVGAAASYLRMFWKVSNYNNLRAEVETIRSRYLRLEQEHTEGKQQMATLQVLASEITTAYGIKRGPQAAPVAAVANLDAAASAGTGMVAGVNLVPTLNETLENYNYLRNSTIKSSLGRSYDLNSPIRPRISAEDRPSLWPLQGRLTSFFGQRLDPFHGHGSFHSGIDISAPTGTPVVAAAPGLVKFAGRHAGYGNLLILQHSGGVETYYAHLSRIQVMEGQRVARGELIGAVGMSGRATSPHLHYEVRIGGSPVNPYAYLKSYSIISAQAAAPDRPKDLPLLN
jgi:murein DD-endopeptidase MepM/ murein hydrolase activator NlpD